MWDSKDLAKHAKDLAKACRGRPRTLPSMPKSCKASLHILGSDDKTWWYTTPLTSQLIRQQVGGFLFDVRLLRPCGSMPRSAKDLTKHAKDLAKYAEDLAKSMPRSAEDIAKHA